MAILTIPDEGREFCDWSQVETFLRERGVRFERWAAAEPLLAAADAEAVLKAYAADVERLKREEGYLACDVISVGKETPNLDQIRNKFLSEHRHSDDEVRYFVEGSGLFWFHLEGSPVFRVKCEKGEFIAVPKDTSHWFDFGPDPYVKCIRLFNDPAGWVATYTGSGIDLKYNPRHEFKQIQCLLFDVEGTTTSLSFVKEKLFPYSRSAIVEFLESHAEQPAVAAILERLAGELKLSPTDAAQIGAALTRWIDEDRKHGDLKSLQGMIWEEGYRAGVYRGHLYPDVVPFWEAALTRGQQIAMFSSGSVKAQQLLLRYSQWGDVSENVSHHFDTAVGPKTDAGSYERIAAELGLAPRQIAFFSDAVPELDAAARAGFLTCRTLRPGVAQQQHNHREIADFSSLLLPTR